MIYIIICFVLLLSFLYIVYVPTVLFNKNTKIKRTRESSFTLFLGASLLFLVLTYMCANFYELKAVNESINCSTSFSNYHCIFYTNMSKTIKPDITVYMIAILQILITIAYAYVTAKSVLNIRKVKKAVLVCSLFFITGFLSSFIHYIIINDALFASNLNWLSCVFSNTYITLPIIYLVIISYLNRDLIKLK